MAGVIAYLIMILAGIAGFSIAAYIFKHKRQKKENLICPLNFKCDDVINSKYSKFLGIPVEIIGLLYYAIISISYLFYLFSPLSAPIWFTQGVIYATILAFIFSIYLLYIQAVVLKQWCSWCILSASLSVVIFANALFSFII